MFREHGSETPCKWISTTEIHIARAMLKAGQGIDSLRTIMKLSEEEVEYVLKA